MEKKENFAVIQEKVKFYVDNISDWARKELLMQLLLYSDDPKVIGMVWNCVEEHWKAFRMPE